MNFRIVTREPGPGDPSRVLFLLPPEDAATAEDMAMLQALYSRDPRPIDDALKICKTGRSGEFMKNYYVGYGHDSIAELGDVIIAIENVPMPVAKLIQHYQLYKGQECSTRYLDFSMQPFACKTAMGRRYQEDLRMFYLEAMPYTIMHMAEFHKLDQTNPTEFKAAKSAAFDVLRGFLPTGALTNLSWTVDLRNLNERLPILWSYREIFPEIKFVVQKIASLFHEVFPTSYKYLLDTYLEPKFHVKHMAFKDELIVGRMIRDDAYMWHGVIDFASWRDLARHRSVVQTFPMLTTKLGYDSFYVDMLPNKFMGRGMELLAKAKYPVDMADEDIYAIPMAYQVPFECKGFLDKFKYIIKLRSSMSVHPTLRSHILNLAKMFVSQCNIYIDGTLKEGWEVSIRRGGQDIVKKEGA